MNWDELYERLTSEFNIQKMGTDPVKKALEIILGDDWIKETVEKVIAYDGQSSELAMNCLMHISSLRAAEIAYLIYKTDESQDRRRMSVWLIKQLALIESYEWVEEFLNNKEVIGWGIGLLDQLLFWEVIDYEEERERIDFLLELSIKNSDGGLKENVDYIKNYLAEREEN